MATVGVIFLLLVGAPLAAWLVTMLPGDHPYALVIVPICWFTAALLFVAAVFIRFVRTRK